jgi:hypothetical protein
MLVGDWQDRESLAQLHRLIQDDPLVGEPQVLRVGQQDQLLVQVIDQPTEYLLFQD